MRGVLEEGVKRSGDPTRRALHLNAPDERIAELYALRAFPGVQPGWKLLSLDWVFGDCVDMEDAKRQLSSKIEQAIKKDLHVDPRERGSEGELARKLGLCRRLADRGQPVFVTAMPGTGPDDVLRHVMRQYDFATFLLRSDVEAADARVPAQDLVRPLTPAISVARYGSFQKLNDELDDKLNSAGNGAYMDG